MQGSRAAFAVAVLALLSGCRNDWRTDMWYSPALRPEDAPRAAPEHSVALGAPPLLEDREDAVELKNPVAADARSLENGAAIFSERCACCHGAGGHGDGPVSKVFPQAPDLAFDTIKAKSDGYIFGTITLGGRAMPPLAEGLSTRDRWDLVNEVRKIQAGPVVPGPRPGEKP